MDRFLIFRRGEFCYNSLNIFSEWLGSALEKLGCPVVFFDIEKEGAIDTEKLSIIKEGGFRAAIAFNAGGQHNTCLPDGKNVFDSYGIPFYNYIVDHPIAHHGNMTSTCKNYYVICVDEEHKEFIDKYYPGVKEAFFIPLAGIEKESAGSDTYEEYIHRPYIIGFTGSYDDFRVLDEEISEYPALLKKIVDSQIDLLLADRSLGIEKSLKIVLDDFGLKDEPSIPFMQVAVSTRIVNRWIKAYIREEVIRYLLLSKEQIHIWGTGWERLTDVSEGSMVLHPPVAYDQLPDIYRKTQICINNMPWFKRGMHDRIPMAMLAGATVLTDGSEYLERVMSAEGDVVCLYDIDQLSKLPQLVTDLVNDPQKCFEIAQKGRCLASEKYTWDSVAGLFLKILEAP